MVEVKVTDRPDNSDHNLWYFIGTVNGKERELICVPSDTGGGCHEVAHKYAESWLASANGSWGPTYYTYAEMSGKWCNLMVNLFEQFIQHQEG
jgi:hypothetical protein